MNITVNLSARSIDEAKEELKRYYAEMQIKAELFNRYLANIGFQEVSTVISSIPRNQIEEGIDVDVEEKAEKGKYTAIISASGSQIAFIEFGAGVYFNVPIGSTTHPDGNAYGYTIGSYNPESPNAGRRGWWKPDGHYTHGTPTYMPMYKGYEEMVSYIKEIAYEVFR